MTQLSDDNNTKTIELIDQFLCVDDKLSEAIDRRSKLLKDVIECVKIINPGLFSWQASTDAYLKQRKFGSVKIEFDKKQTLFADGDEFVAKNFIALLGTLTVDIIAKRHFLLTARLYFGELWGKLV